MRIVIVTGMSGAGKSASLKMLEDMGFYCVDNLPIRLIDTFVELFKDSSKQPMDIALGIDSRNPESLYVLGEELARMRREVENLSVLFLDASDECLIKRFKETRRSHPLAAGRRVETGIAQERKILEDIREQADYVINTSKLLTRELRSQLEDIFLKGRSYYSLFVTILSFGFKNGIPADADLVFDVRFLPNPYYYEDMRSLTGNDEKVRSFVMNSDVTKEFLTKLKDMITFLIPHYIEEGKTQLVVAIGCTGGKHRSVTIANELYETLSGGEGYGLKLDHRDIGQDARRKDG